MLVAKRLPEPSTVGAGVYPCEGSTDRPEVHERSWSQSQNTEQTRQETLGGVQVMSLGT